MTPKRLQKTIYNAAIICLLAAGLIYVFSRFVHAGVAYTDNAQVRQHITPVNTRVSGFIDRICFEEFQPVKQRLHRAAVAVPALRRACAPRTEAHTHVADGALGCGALAAPYRRAPLGGRSDGTTKAVTRKGSGLFGLAAPTATS